MKRTRLILIVLLSLVLVSGLLVFGAFSSNVQTWAVRKALARQEGLQAGVSRVSLSLDRVVVEGLSYETEGLTLTLPRLEAELSLFSAFRGDVQISRIEARDWVVLITQNRAQSPALSTVAAPTPEQSVQAFQGLLSRLEFPVDVRVSRFDLAGTVVIAENQEQGTPEQRFSVLLEGAGLGLGQEAEAHAKVEAQLKEGDGFEALRANALLKVKMLTARQVSALGATVALEARGGRFPQGVMLNLEAKAQQLTDGESLLIELRRGEEQLLRVDALLSAAGAEQTVVGSWTVSLKDGDLSPFMRGRALPVFELKGVGKFSNALKQQLLHFDGSLAGTTDKLSAFDSRLAALGQCSLTTRFDVSVGAQLVSVRQLELELAEPQSSVLLASVSQPFELSFSDFSIKAPDQGKSLVLVKCKALPIAWLAPFIPEYSLHGGSLSGSWGLVSHGRGFGLQTVDPLTVPGLGFSVNRTPVLENASLKASLSADFTEEGWQFELAQLTLERASGRLLSLQAKAGQRRGADKPVVVQGELALDLQSLSSQSLARSYQLPDAGAASFQFKGTLGQAMDVYGKLNTQGLTQAGSLLADANIELRLTLDQSGVLKIVAPVLLTPKGGAPSTECNLEGTLQTRLSPMHLEGSIEGRVLSLDDLFAFTSLGARKEAAPAQAAAAGGQAQQKGTGAPIKPDAHTLTPDTVAFWSVVEGWIQLKSARLLLNPRSELTDLEARLEVSAGELMIAPLRAKGPDGATLTFDGTIRFEPGPQPYSLRAKLKTVGFEVGGFTSGGDGTLEPSLSGKFDIDSKLKGSGANLEDLFTHTTGTFNLLSKGGKFRLLRSDISEFIQGKSGLGGLVMGGITSLLSSKKGDGEETKSTNKLDEYARAALELADYFAEIPFDQMSLLFSRDEDLNLKLEELALIAPDVRITGLGGMTHQEGCSFAAQPLALQLQLATRGRIAELLGKAGLLKETKDNLGYLPLNRELKVKGSLGDPDNKELRELLRKIALQKADAFLDRLIGGGN